MVVSHFQPEFGGHEFYLSKSLVNMGLDVTLYTSDRGRPGYSYEKFLKNDDKNYGFEIIRFHAPLEISEIPFCKGLRKKLNEEKFDIIHSHEFFQMCSLMAFNASKNKNSPFILTQHGSSPPINKFIRAGYLLNKITVGKYIMKKADRVIALTPEVKNDLVNIGVYENKIDIIPTGVSVDKYKPTNKPLTQMDFIEKDFIILFVGRLVENKGVINLIMAFKKVLDEKVKANLVIVGEGNLKKKLIDLTKKLGLSENVHFMGSFKQEMMPYVYPKANVLVLPTIYKEPFGIVAIEALASGIPVIATEIDGLKYIINDGDVGFLVKPNDIESLSKKILEIMENDKLRDTMRINARRRAVEEFSWGTIAERIYNAYKKCTESNM